MAQQMVAGWLDARFLIDIARARRRADGVRPSRIVVFGREPAHWIRALQPDLPIWTGLDGVEEVLLAQTSWQLLRCANAEGRPAVVLPLRERQIARCPRWHWGLWPTKRVLATLRDKVRFACYLEETGLADCAPRRFAWLDAVRFPAVVKQARSAAGQGVELVRDEDELDAVLQRPDWQGVDTLVQAYVGDGIDRVTHAVLARGRVVWHRTYLYHMAPEIRIQRQHTPKTTAPVPTPAEDLQRLAAILGPLGYDGPVAMDSRELAGGRSCLFEINPRLGGSLFWPGHAADLRAALTALIGHARPMGR